MSRRLLGPIGGPIVFFLVAALVFAGLGWVTYAALGVERAQREAAAQAELGYNLRVAMRQLDTRMLSTLTVEDSRPFYHYDAGDPSTTYGPLLAATLPEWMKLHFQLDAADGWTSPQVLPADIADRMRETWPETLRNLNGDRTVVCESLKERFPSRMTWDLFAARDRAIPADSLEPFAAPWFTGNLNSPLTQGELTPNPIPPATLTPKPPPTTPVSGKPAGNTVYILGFELCWDDGKQQLAHQLTQQQVGNTIHQKDVDKHQQLAHELAKTAPSPQAVQQGQAAGQEPGRLTPRGGRGQREGDDNERAMNDYLNRAGTISRGVQEAKQAGADPRSNYQFPLNQNYGPFPIDPKNNPGPYPALPTPPGNVTPVTSPPGMPTSPAPIASPALPGGPVAGGAGSAGDKEKLQRELALRLSEADVRLLGGLFGEASKSLRAKREKDEARAILDEVMKRLDGKDGTAAEYFRLLDQTQRRRFVQEQEQNKERLAAPAAPIDANGKAKAAAATTVPPGEDHPPVPPAIIPAPVIVGPVEVHLGSMRPQWVTAPDGTDMLVLVRSVKFQNKTIYQGVVIDWAKLQQALKDEVKEYFPDAMLVPVKDADGVSPDRAMTALPVQLDPGPQPELPPAGWTPLRIGLVIAWAAAFIAIVAVGFSGWSLIDLAERRIRFVSAVTHELRTPLTSLRLYLDMLLSGMIQDEAKRQEYLNTLATESDRLHRLIDNVLDFAKLEKRKKNGDVKPVNVGELLATLGATWTDRVAQDGKELVVVSTLPAEREVCTDAAMLQQIVGNLIDNARKYTRDAADKRIWLWAKPGPGNSVLLEVEDRGPGVPAGERKAIFKPFRRGSCADATAGGAGLGLALAKSWTEVLGATLTYRPADGGVGACFRLELPGK